MTQFLTLLMLGAASGAIYALNALGILVVFRSSGVVNFAAGAIGMAGAFLNYELINDHGWNPVLAMILGVGLSAVLGIISYGLVMKPLHTGSNLTRVIATVGVLLILEAIAQLRYGNDTHTLTGILPTGTVRLGGGVTIGIDRIWLFGIAAALTIALAVVYRRTMFGILTTAVSENPRGVSALGSRLDVIRGGNWLIGGAVSGLSALLLTPILGLSVASGTGLLIPSLAAALFGGLTSFGWTFAGGLLIGILQSETLPYANTISGLPDAIPFIAIIAVLVFRGDLLPLRSYVNERLPALGTGILRWRSVLVLTIAASLLLLFVVPQDWQYAITVSLVTSVVLLSVVVVTGYAGQLSLVQASLAGVSAMAAAQLLSRTSLPNEIVLVLAVLAALPFGLLVGLPSLRTRGISLAIATLGMAVAIQALLFSNGPLTNNGFGVDITKSGTRSLILFGIAIDPLDHPGRYAVFVLLVLVLLGAGVANLRRGRTGLRFIAVRNNERAAAALGLNVSGVKLAAFVFGAGIAGFGGVLIAWQSQSVTFGTYGSTDNLNAVAFAVIGGVGTIVGAVTGGLLQPGGVGELILDAISSSWAAYLSLVSGILLLINVISSPDGVTGPPIIVARKIMRALQRPPREPAAAVAPVNVSALSPAGEPSAGGFPGPAEGLLGPAAPSEMGRRDGPVLRVTDLSVSFGGIKAVVDVSFEARPGEVLAIIGPNGAGKTTLIDAVTGFVASKGQVMVDELRIDSMPAYRRARQGVGRSFQSLELFEELTVLDNLRAAADRHDRASYAKAMFTSRGLPGAAEFAELTSLLGLSGTEGTLASSLEHGRRRMLGVGRALAARPDIIMLDEPCAGLDPSERAQFARYVRLVADKLGVAVILVEHDVDLVKKVADRVVALDFGRLIAEGAPEAVLSDPAVVRAYLGIDVSGAEAEPPTLTNGGAA